MMVKYIGIAMGSVMIEELHRYSQGSVDNSRGPKIWQGGQ